MAIQALLLLAKHEGLAGMFKGLSLNLIKVVKLVVTITFQVKLMMSDFLDDTESNGHGGFVCCERPLEGRPWQDETSVRLNTPIAPQSK